MLSILLFTALAAADGPALASKPRPAVAAEAVVVGGQPATALRAGTPVVLRLLTELTTKGKNLKVGDRFPLEVAEPVVLNGQIVVPVGSPAVGEVTLIRNKGMWGKSGNIETRLLYLTTNDRPMRISGAIADKGVAGGGAAVVTSAIVFLPAGFFMTGTSALIEPGTIVRGLLDEDVPVIFAGSKPRGAAVVAVSDARGVAAPAAAVVAIR